MNINVAACPRCTGQHQQVVFAQLTNHEAYGWWAMCPTTHQPLLLRPADQPAPGGGEITYTVVT